MCAGRSFYTPRVVGALLSIKTTQIFLPRAAAGPGAVSSRMHLQASTQQFVNGTVEVSEATL